MPLAWTGGEPILPEPAPKRELKSRDTIFLAVVAIATVLLFGRFAWVQVFNPIDDSRVAANSGPKSRSQMSEIEWKRITKGALRRLRSSFAPRR